jgi:hypothetical protein
VKAAGNDVPLPSGGAYIHDGVLEVVLANKAVSCDALEEQGKAVDDPHRTTLTISVPVGPGGKLWGGARVGVAGQLEGFAGFKGSYVASDRLTASVEPFEPKPGAHVKGWADFAETEATGGGAFDVTLCHPPSWSASAPALSGDVPNAPLAGTLAGEAPVSKKVLAVVQHDKAVDADHITTIEWYAQDDVTCNDLRAKPRQHLPYLMILNIGGASANRDYSGTQQPAKAAFRPSTWNPKLPPRDGPAWVKLERLVFDEGQSLTGSVRGVYEKGALAGTFTAQICRE